MRDREPENGIQQTKEGQAAGHWDRENKSDGVTMERWSKRKTVTESKMKIDQ